MRSQKKTAITFGNFPLPSIFLYNKTNQMHKFIPA
jgi:hypothetical protein